MRLFGAVLTAACVFGAVNAARAADPDAKAVIDKAIKAAGGEEKLAKIKAFSWKTKGVITFGDNDNDFTSESTLMVPDKYHSQFNGEFNGNAVTGITVFDGKNGWRKFGDNQMEMDEDALVNERHNIELMVLPTVLLPLKSDRYKLGKTGEEKVGDKPATFVTATGPTGKTVKLWFDAESGLPVKMEARVMGFGGEEFTQETRFSAYKEFDGIKKATKLESLRDGNRFVDQEVIEFKLLEKVDPELFKEPK